MSPCARGGCAVFYILPTVAALFVSFTRYPILRPPEWNGGTNYLTIFANPSFRRSILNTALYSVYFIPTKIVLAFLVATAITRSSARLSGVFLVACYVPRMTSMVVASFIWLWLYQPDNGPRACWRCPRNCARPRPSMGRAPDRRSGGWWCRCSSRSSCWW